MKCPWVTGDPDGDTCPHVKKTKRGLLFPFGVNGGYYPDIFNEKYCKYCLDGKRVMALQGVKKNLQSIYVNGVSVDGGHQ